jgi:hypothetical protein
VDEATNKTKRRYAHASLAPLLVLATLVWIGGPASGQTATTPIQPGPVGPPIRYQDNDTTRQEIAGMDNFLDSHPEIAEQLRKDPSLINNATWVQSHPALQQYLQSHPEVREEFSENPNAFMRREERYDRREDWRAVGDMDRFLDSHREIAEQLRKDPSLINNRQWVENHPALEQYLQSHPEVREEFKANPSAFMEREERYDRREDAREDVRGDRDLTRGQLASMDRFLDGHREIAEQLRKDPSLIDNRQWVANHPALQQYLQSHPEVREEFRENPNSFMQAENRYDWREGDRDRMGDRDHGELTSFGQFLGGHSAVAQELSSNPSLANNKEYLANHPELGDYLKAHPAMTQQLASNPQAVMSSNWVMQASGVTATGVPAKPKVGPNQ